MPRRRALIASTLAVAVLLVGCGSDDDSSDEERDTTTTAAETTTTGSDEEPTSESSAPEETTTTADAEEPTTTVAGDGEEGGDGTGDPEFCATYADFNERFEDLPEDSVEDIQDGFVAVRDALIELEGIAPEELSEAVALLSDGVQEVVEQAADATTVEEAQQAALDVFSDDQFNTAGETVDAYFQERCAEANDEQAPSAEAPEADEVEPPTTEG